MQLDVGAMDCNLSSMDWQLIAARHCCSRCIYRRDVLSMLRGPTFPSFRLDLIATRSFEESYHFVNTNRLLSL